MLIFLITSQKMNKSKYEIFTSWLTENLNLGLLVGFYGISVFVGYLTPNPIWYK